MNDLVNDLVNNGSEPLIGGPVGFRLFDGVEARAGGERVDLGPAKERCLLVGLLAARGRAVARHGLLAWVWDEPSNSASADLDRFMARLRKRLKQVGLTGALDNRDGLCRLNVPPDLVDVHRFHDLVARARDADDQRAAKLLAEALELSTGEPLAGVTGFRIDGYRKALREDRFAAELSYLQRELRLERHRERIPDLTRLLTERPADATVAAFTMYALYRAGRQDEALRVYTGFADLYEESGLDVPPPLAKLQRDILRNEDCREVIGGVTPSPGPKPGPAKAPDLDGNELAVSRVDLEAADEAPEPPAEAVAILATRHLVVLVGDPVANRAVTLRLLHNGLRREELSVVDVVKDWERPRITALLPPRASRGYLLTLNHPTRDRADTAFAEDLLTHAGRLADHGSYLVVIARPELWRECWPVLSAETVRLTGLVPVPRAPLDREHLGLTDPDGHDWVYPLDRQTRVRLGREVSAGPPPDIVLDSAPLSPISRDHARLEYSGGWWFVPTGKNPPSIRRRGTTELQRIDDRTCLRDGDVVRIEVGRAEGGQPRAWALELRDPQKTSTYQGDDQ